MRDFRTLNVWQKSHNLTLAIYRLTREFPEDEKFGLTSQIRRAAVSIGSNLAEGSGRGSDADYLRFVHIASGSASEVEYQLLVARDLSYVSGPHLNELETQVQEIKRMLGGLIRRLNANRNA